MTIPTKKERMGKLLRGIRGATTVKNNEAKEILEATRELLQTIVSENDVKEEDIASAIFTVTPDLNAEFPAGAARKHMGWQYIPLLCAVEIGVPKGLKRCIRVLLHVHTDRAPKEIKHIYLREAVKLRPDLAPR